MKLKPEEKNCLSCVYNCDDHEEEERFFKLLYTSRNTNANLLKFIKFFNTKNVSSEETAKTCKDIMSINECKHVLMTIESISALNDTMFVFNVL